MAALLKLLDKLLFCRIWPLILKQVLPWQGGGISGADVMAWMAAEVLQLRRVVRKTSSTFAAFVDGENAFCRPPADVVTEDLIRVPGINHHDCNIILAILRSLRGTACIFNSLHGNFNR
jgi:hypothetical protein